MTHLNYFKKIPRFPQNNLGRPGGGAEAPLRTTLLSFATACLMLLSV